MKLLDANILLYAYDSSSTHHQTCRAWLESAFNADEMIALPWQTILAFVRISTNPRAVKHPLSSANACAIVDTWLERPNIVVINAADRFRSGRSTCSWGRRMAFRIREECPPPWNVRT